MGKEPSRDEVERRAFWKRVATGLSILGALVATVLTAGRARPGS